MTERDMYRQVAGWLQSYLSQRFKYATVWTGDVHAQKVSSILTNRSVTRSFPEVETYEVKADVLGLVTLQKRTFVALAECKIKAVTLMDLSQIIGYARIIRPALAIIVSPQGWAEAVDKLINTFNRQDILEYREGAKVVVAHWDMASNSVTYGKSLPHGYLSAFKALPRNDVP